MLINFAILNNETERSIKVSNFLKNEMLIHIYILKYDIIQGLAEVL